MNYMTIKLNLYTFLSNFCDFVTVKKKNLRSNAVIYRSFMNYLVSSSESDYPRGQYIKYKKSPKSKWHF